MLKKNYRGNSGKGIFQASLVSGFLMELLRLLKSIENEIGFNENGDDFSGNSILTETALFGEHLFL